MSRNTVAKPNVDIAIQPTFVKVNDSNREETLKISRQREIEEKQRLKEEKEEKQRPSMFTSDGRPKPKPADPIQSVEDYRKIVNYFLDKNEYRNAMLVVLGVHLGERCGDLLSIQFKDIMNEKGVYKKEFTIWEEKTSKWSQPMVMPEEARIAIDLYTYSLEDYSLDDYLFMGQRGVLTVSSAWRILKEMSRDLGLDYNVSTHTLRKSFAFFARKANPENATLELLQMKYNHTDQRTTKCYITETKHELFNLQNSISDILK